MVSIFQLKSKFFGEAVRNPASLIVKGARVMKKKVGIITIGQAPRSDLFPEVARFFDEKVEFIQRGVLDQLDSVALKKLLPASDEITLVSKLKDGTPVTMAKEKIIPIIQAIIDQFNQEHVDLIILACTGAFKSFQSDTPIIYPDYLLNHTTQGLFRNNGQIGVIVPLTEQIDAIKLKWKQAGFDAICSACSPYEYTEEAMARAVTALNHMDVEAIVLDCIGYTSVMKEVAKKHSVKPVILSRNMVFQNAAELL